jgi:hypothetical protein
MRAAMPPPMLWPSTMAFLTPSASVAWMKQRAESQSVHAGLLVLVAPWPRGSRTSRFAAPSRAASATCGRNSVAPLANPGMSTSVGLVALSVLGAW